VTSTELFARDLVSEAEKTKDESPACAPPNRPPRPAFKVHSGWSFGLDVYDHPPRIHLAENTTTVSHYRMSAKLYPLGRGSIDEDWRMLGETVRAVTIATGYPDSAPTPSPLLPIEATHPNSTIMWMWHSDGSPIDQDVLDGTAKVLAMLQTPEREVATKKGLAAPLEKVGRNDECPCGSKKKFKKCHGASN